MLTAADWIDDKASGFELGADDYLTKPFDLGDRP
jgi:DNA-binding response OmpR family regulator